MNVLGKLMPVVGLAGALLLSACGDQLARSDPEERTGVATVQQAAEELNVTICHRPPGNRDASHPIDVSPEEVAEHLAHGDTLYDDLPKDTIYVDVDTAAVPGPGPGDGYCSPFRRVTDGIGLAWTLRHEDPDGDTLTVHSVEASTCGSTWSGGPTS